MTANPADSPAEGNPFALSRLEEREITGKPEGEKKMKKLLLILLCQVAILLAASAESRGVEALAETGEERVEWPQTRAARFAKAFFEAYNTEGKNALERFVKEHYSEEYLKETPLEEELASHLQLKKFAGKLAVHSVSSDGDKVDIIARSELFGWMKFQIQLSSEPPHDPTSFSGRPTSAPESESAKEYNDWKDLDDLLQKVCRDSGAPGMAASIVHGGKIVEKAVVGVRCIDEPDQIVITDRFHVGSVGKTFTGTMIGMLLQQKVLRWEETIKEILPDIPMMKEYESVTLADLLGHRGGVPSLPAAGEFSDGFPPLSDCPTAEARAALVRQVLSEEPVNPGAYSYSNAGYVVAACMAERATNRPWEKLMRTLVFEPIGLHSAGFGWPATRERPGQPRGHYGSPPELKVQEIGEHLLGDLDYIGPAGNMHCSIEDLARFAQFILRVLDGQEKSLEAGAVPRFWRVGQTASGERMFCFFGSGGTFFAMIALFPDSDLAVVAATNCGLHAWSYMEKMRDAVHGRMKSSK